MTHQDYISAVEELFSKHPSVQYDGFSARAYKPGLEAIMRVDDALGNPWKSYKCIHVAGTNGKGSVCSMLAAALAARGFRVGLFTSPHISDFRERMKVIENSGPAEMIPEEEVLGFLEDNKALVEGLSFFETVTAMAFDWFRKIKVDWAVVEVGLGGRLDATNIITPELSVITSIGLDHCALLGSTRAEIAAEKAGIFKRGVPALCAENDAETSSVFKGMAEEKGAVLSFAQERAFEWDTDLKGNYQKKNIRTVLNALELLGIPADKNAIRNAGHISGLHGRWEMLKGRFIIDIGHNPPALKENFSQLERSGAGKLYIIFGIMADKALDDIAPYFPADAEYFLCAPKTSRALGAGLLRERISALRPELSTRVFPSVEAAVAEASELTENKKGCLVYVGGSTFVVSEAFAFLTSL